MKIISILWKYRNLCLTKSPRKYACNIYKMFQGIAPNTRSTWRFVFRKLVKSRDVFLVCEVLEIFGIYKSCMWIILFTVKYITLQVKYFLSRVLPNGWEPPSPPPPPSLSGKKLEYPHQVKSPPEKYLRGIPLRDINFRGTHRKLYVVISAFM